MPQMISYGGELIRISPKDSKKLEYSKNNGLSWNARCGGSGNYGKFIDLMDNGKEILATTEKGLFYSTNKGLSGATDKPCGGGLSTLTQKPLLNDT